MSVPVSFLCTTVHSKHESDDEYTFPRTVECPGFVTAYQADSSLGYLGPHTVADKPVAGNTENASQKEKLQNSFLGLMNRCEDNRLGLGSDTCLDYLRDTEEANRVVSSPLPIHDIAVLITIFDLHTDIHNHTDQEASLQAIECSVVENPVTYVQVFDSNGNTGDCDSYSVRTCSEMACPPGYNPQEDEYVLNGDHEKTNGNNLP